MLTYLIKRQMNKKDDGMSKPMMFAGAVITGVGAYATYRMIKNIKSKSQMSQMIDKEYYGNNQYNDYKYDEFGYECDCSDKKQDYEYEELKKKVREFNSRRINCENCPHVSQEEMMHYVNSVKNDKKDIDLHEDDKKNNIYKEEEYKKYEEE
ncbi:hypothetical protein [Clostridioides sp. ZZV14-6153]|uniref:hypothetical protein n=1 Tax=Clostridioides sp. ZZV14-6153 TaxID=2811494 RepID=UPI001D116E5C|nr:hypothetical protein [Clostridioides sp. ZZV14-6153]